MGLQDIAHVSTSVSDEDEDWSDTSVSSHMEMPVLALNSEVVCVNERTVGVWGLPLTVCNSRFRSGASDGTLLSEGMTWLCFLSSADVKTGEVGAMSMDLGSQSLDHWQRVVWNPGIMGQQRVYLCYDCLCLMALFRAIRLLIQDWAVWPVWTGMIPGDCRTIPWEVGWICGLITPCDVNCLCAVMNRRIKGIQGDVVVEMTDRVDDNRLQRCADACEDLMGVFSVGRTRTLVIGRLGCVCASVGCCDCLKGCAVIFVTSGGVWIGNIRCTLWGGSSTDAAPVTGSLVSFTLLDCLNDYCAAECDSGWLFCGTACVCFARGEIFIWGVGLYWTKTIEGAALVKDRAGITFGVELFVPWDAPEAVVDIQSEGVVPLGSIPDVVGLVGHRPDATGSRILQGRDVRSIRVLVPDARGLKQNFHDVTIVDMGDVPEASVSLPELSVLREQWPSAVFRHMVWLQQDMEMMRADAKKRFRQTKPSPCVDCGRVIKCDMHRHVAKFHLDLPQLWR